MTPRRLLLRLLLLLLPLTLLSGCDEPEFSPIDADSEKPYSILKGYLKRRDGNIEKPLTDVHKTENGYIFRWQSPQGERLFQLHQKNKAWIVKEITPQDAAAVKSKESENK